MGVYWVGKKHEARDQLRHISEFKAGGGLLPPKHLHSNPGILSPEPQEMARGAYSVSTYPKPAEGLFHHRTYPRGLYALQAV